MAAAASCSCSSMVFVGNIPYHATEEELRGACEEIGPVVSLRVATDKATGKPRGFAFCEYLDDETARSACRNLNGHALRGRALRVGLADQGRRRSRAGEPDEPVGADDATHAASMLVSARPSVEVTAYLAGLSWRQLREMVDAVDGEDAGVVERTMREYVGFATVIEQARILLDMAAEAVEEDVPARGKGKKKNGVREPCSGGSPELGSAAQKLRKLDNGKPVPDFAHAQR